MNKYVNQSKAKTLPVHNLKKTISIADKTIQLFKLL